MWTRLKKISALTKMSFRWAHQSPARVPLDVKPPEYWLKRAVEHRELAECARGITFEETFPFNTRGDVFYLKVWLFWVSANIIPIKIVFLQLEKQGLVEH